MYPVRSTCTCTWLPTHYTLYYSLNGKVKWCASDSIITAVEGDCNLKLDDLLKNNIVTRTAIVDHCCTVGESVCGRVSEWGREERGERSLTHAHSHTRARTHTHTHARTHTHTHSLAPIRTGGGNFKVSIQSSGHLRCECNSSDQTLEMNRMINTSPHFQCTCTYLYLYITYNTPITCQSFHARGLYVYVHVYKLLAILQILNISSLMSYMYMYISGDFMTTT